MNARFNDHSARIQNVVNAHNLHNAYSAASRQTLIARAF